MSKSAWLIEADGSYWDGRSCDRRAFTKDVNDAMRLSRFEDAERIKHWLIPGLAFALKTTEHVWVERETEDEG